MTLFFAFYRKACNLLHTISHLPFINHFTSKIYFLMFYPQNVSIFSSWCHPLRCCHKGRTAASAPPLDATGERRDRSKPRVQHSVDPWTDARMSKNVYRLVFFLFSLNIFPFYSSSLGWRLDFVSLPERPQPILWHFYGTLFCTTQESNHTLFMRFWLMVDAFILLPFWVCLRFQVVLSRFKIELPPKV